ncbi:hypothetical protein B0H15DRAFT_953635 [Mycena belliarum]|uniref:CxC2-like cysteine cluster KDZ transposase-associated domain-containing protein n=1 Tax=Mycena belliarum TaxID=1033014 RepID=A0AAD6TWK3_9AGAR|nr:hypothetical protein B0H15DRAFT_953635 [Mycena belliae]
MAHLTARARKAAYETMQAAGSSVPVLGPHVGLNTRTKEPFHIAARPDIYLPNGRTLVQPRLPQLSYAATGNVRDDEHEGYDDRDMVAPDRTPPPDSKRHQRKRLSQWRRWQLEVIPKIIPEFTRILYKTKTLRHIDSLPLPPTPSDTCLCVKKVLKVAIVRFSAVEDVQLTICLCHPAAEQLMRCGAFPCAPILPSLAVDLRVLEFAKNLFLQIAPNTTAFATTLEQCLGSMGFQLQHQYSLRRRFGNCLQWYIHLRTATKAHYARVIETARLHYLGIVEAPPAVDDEAAREAPLDQDVPPASPDSSPTPAQRGRHAHRNGDPRSASTTPTPPSPSPSPAPRQRKRQREESPKRPRPSNPFPEPSSRTRASEYLRRRCPACFGDMKRDPSVLVDFCVCIDACFTQKRLKGKGHGGRDPPRFHPDSHFIDEEDAARTEAYVDGVRNASAADTRHEKRQKAMRDALAEEPSDGYEHPLLRLPTSTLDACESSFTAANENREKASAQFFEDTAIMGMICRHDRVLWLVNMHSAGEKQFNVFALVEQLFQEIPRDIRVGLLYDVACGLERSCRRWGFLERYIDRLEFAVSVFHAFGHEWACQLIYHPRKRGGFGFTNGEGCERFWHSISHLIANLRICGYHNRIYTLDMQIEHADEASLKRLGEWIRRRHMHSAEKRRDAEKILAECGKPIALLRAQWALQVEAQTKPLPRRTKKKGEDAVNAVLLLRSSVKTRKTQVADLRREFLDAVMDEEPDAPLRKIAFESASEALAKAQSQLSNKEAALGVTERQSLNGLGKSQYMQLRMNARALKRRLRDRLRARKFELDRVERSFRRLVNEEKLYTHTESAVKRREPTISKVNADYNKLCREMSSLVAQGKAPRGAVAPVEIPAKGVWKLDVDDAVWEDVGLDDDQTRATEPPLWLSDEKVRTGIKAMLELDRSVEEDIRLKKERRALQVWFAEEWAVVNLAIGRAESSRDRYQLQLIRDDLVRLCATWEQRLPDLGVDIAALPPWGPSALQLATCVVDAHVAARGEDRHYDAEHDEDDEDDSEEEEEGQEEDIETLAAVEAADMYRSAQNDYL